jgi:hypothetical protein
MKVQTSALRARRTVASIAGVLALGMIFAGGAARAQSVGELSPGMVMNKGWLAIAVPPIRLVDGRRVVMASAAESEWTVKFGPFLDLADCGSVLSRYSRGSLLDSDYEAYKAGRTLGVDEAQILADVQARNARCIVSTGSERFRLPGTFKVDPTTDLVR